MNTRAMFITLYVAAVCLLVCGYWRRRTNTETRAMFRLHHGVRL